MSRKLFQRVRCAFFLMINVLKKKDFSFNTSRRIILTDFFHEELFIRNLCVENYQQEILLNIFEKKKSLEKYYD